MPTSKDDATTLSHFNSINSDTLEKTVRSLSSSTSELDVLPTKFFKTIFHLISADILQIINTSLQTGIFPTSLKTAVVKPLLKKASLDASTPSNYRSISNLPFIGKVLEKVVYTQVSAFLTATCCFDLYQSGFREHHSTETALIKVVNDIRTNNDAGKTTVLMLLDLSAAFDTVDHHILLHTLEHWVGLSGTVLSWLRSYLENRSFTSLLGILSQNLCPYPVASLRDRFSALFCLTYTCSPLARSSNSIPSLITPMLMIPKSICLYLMMISPPWTLSISVSLISTPGCPKISYS